jgi:hypothetical protein
MADSFPPEVTVIEGAGGVCYRFPVRPLGAQRWLGVAVLVPGLVLCALPLGAAWKLLLVLVQGLPADSGWFWLFAAILTLPLVPIGFKLASVGLFIVAGHSEIALYRSTLSARECCGLLRWGGQRPTAHLRRFLVSASLGPLHGNTAREAAAASLNVLFGWCSGLGVINPEWKAAVVGHQVQPLWLAPGYPRPWLLAVANDLARRCALLPERKHLRIT